MSQPLRIAREMKAKIEMMLLVTPVDKAFLF